MSIYPNAIDGQAQLPIVRDKVTEISAATVNGLRTAIINIQTELGLVPKADYASVAARLNELDVQLAEIEAQLAGVSGTGYQVDTRSFHELANSTIRERWRSYGDTVLDKFNMKAVSGVSTSAAGTYILNLKREDGATESLLDTFNLETLVDRTDTELTLAAEHEFADGEYLIVEIVSDNADLTGGSGIAVTPTFRTA